MCGVAITKRIEEGKKIMSSLFTRLGSSASVPAQAPAFAGSIGTHTDKKTDSRKEKK